MAAVEYHWIIMLNGTAGPGREQVMVGNHGLITRDPAVTTRKDIADELIASLRDAFLARTGTLLEDWTIANFALEPNKLAGEQ
ncbi:hypothetical protein [Streptomyces silvensis]|uniref:Uncharacterized protein n=1 Tax=Streptomyces silvensis TaxID=1765722 RepID=A0A0W7X3U7_9ACTN|nr:hypothetical protein [Streptomyces silvensis]KUF17354.1 hypothetical protein AT728_16240 [Streptomyces silvensis]